MKEPSENKDKKNQNRKFFRLRKEQDKNYNQGGIFIDSYTGEFKSGWVWFVTTVPVCILPIILLYLYKLITDENKVELSTYTGDALLIIVSISCSIVFLCSGSQKKRKESFKVLVKVIGGVLALSAGGFYAFINGAGKSMNEKTFYVVCMAIVILFSLIGIFIGNNNDKNANEYNQKKLKECRELFALVKKPEFDEAFQGINDRSFYCELQEVDLIEKIKYIKEKNKKNDNSKSYVIQDKSIKTVNRNKQQSKRKNQ